jgi:hypothetical protein
MTTAQQLIKKLGLKPHPEGAYYRETYRSTEDFKKDALPRRYDGVRCFGTAIYYLLTADTFSYIHRIKTDEIYHFYLGSPVALVQLVSDGTGFVTVLGKNLEAGMNIQATVSRGTWQGAQLVRGGQYALLGTTVAPGFEFEDVELGRRSTLLQSFPAFRNLIIALTQEEPAKERS